MVYQSYKQFFEVLNNKVDYLVLRNYESFFSDGFTGVHPDIDILCSAPVAFLHAVSSYSRTRNKKDMIHRAVIIGGKEIAVDVRYIGDGYYCKAWEIEMLKTKVNYHSFCYVLNLENYFYSLLYHVHIQKDYISKDYFPKLIALASSLGLTDQDSLSLESLQQYMRQNGYTFTYPIFHGGKAHFKRVDKSMIEKNRIRQIQRFLFKIKRTTRRLRLWGKK